MSEQRKRQGKEKADVTIPAASSLLEMPHTYVVLLESIKAQVQSARLKIVQRFVAQFPWKSNRTLIEKIKAQVSQSVTPSKNRNEARFPEQFRFQLTQTEIEQSVTNCDRFAMLAKVTI